MAGHPADALSAYVDGTLTPPEAAEIAAHLAECDHCRAVVDDLLTVRSLLRSLPAPAPHPSLLPRTLARLRDRRRQPRSLGWGLALVLGAAVAALVLQWPMMPTPGRGAPSSAWYFQRQAEMALTHPMTDVTLTSYLSSSLPYDPAETGEDRR
jgi:anti-sigma factor RsiW